MNRITTDWIPSLTTLRKNFARRFLLLALCSLFLAGCAKEPVSLDFDYSIIQKPVTVKIAPSLKEHREIILRVCREEMERLGAILDETDEDSEIAMINRLGPGVTFPINSEMNRMIRFCTDFEERSEGQFTALIYPIGYMWGFHGNPNPVGISPEIATASLDSLHTSTFRLTEKTIELNSPFTRLDVGGIAEGYITDLTIIRLRVQNVSGIMVKVGDSARALGGKDDGTPYTFPIPHPFEEGKIVGHVELKNRIAASMSNIHRLQSQVDGQIIGHIINPITAMPVTNTVQTVGIATSATKSDALATSLAVAGTNKSPRLLHRFGKDSPVYGIIIPNKQPLEIHISKGAEQYFQVAPEYASSVTHLATLDSQEAEAALQADGLQKRERAERLRQGILSNKDIAVEEVPTSATVDTNKTTLAEEYETKKP